MRAELTAESQRTIRKLIGTDAMPLLRAEMKVATAPMVPAVKTAIRSLPSQRSRYKSPGGSLRNAVANAVQRKMNMNGKNCMILIKVVPKGGKSNLATVMEGTKPWHHPTFGHDPEVDQPSHPVFYKTLDHMAPAVEAKIAIVLSKMDRIL